MMTKPDTQLLPEWHKQAATLLAWPHPYGCWKDLLADIEPVYIELVKHLCSIQPVIVLCYDEDHRQHIQACYSHPNLIFVIISTDDIWIRDYGPISTINKQQQILCYDFQFNAWGNKYKFERDAKATQQLFKSPPLQSTHYQALDFILEGGSLDTNGETILTTSRCLLSSARNRGWNKADWEVVFSDYFNIQDCVWLDSGAIIGDDTDSHIDTLARFINPTTICYAKCEDKKDEHYEELKRMEQQLKNSCQGRYELLPLPLPKPKFKSGQRLPATYINFLLSNESVILPIYDDPADDIAFSQLATCIHDRQIVKIFATPLLYEGGSIHCASMQLPEGALQT